MATKFIIIFFLLAMSFFMSAAEVAFYSVTSSKEEIAGGVYRSLVKSPQTLLTTILVSNSVANFLFALYGASLALDVSRAMSIDRTFSVIMEIILVTATLVFVADAIPKIVASNNPKLIVALSMPVLAFLVVVETPIVYPINSILSKLNARRRRPSLTIDNESLKLLSRIAGSAGVLEPQEAELLRKIAFLGEKNVKDTMTLRTGITSVPVESNFDSLVEAFRKSEHSRLPVYSGSPENIVGMLYARDFLPLLSKKRTQKKLNVVSLMRKPVFVPETQSLEMLLETFKNNKVHIAVAVDEFGGLAGIVTLSDVVREIFGTSAEMPRENMMPIKVGEGAYVVTGGAKLDDLSAEVGGFDFEFSSDETVSALLIEKNGSVPRVGTRVKAGSYEFEVAQATPKAILQVRFRRLY